MNWKKHLNSISWTSQFGQDRWVLEEALPGKKGGVFVDIGAHDGVYLSNTCALERNFGWKGLCVEANSRLYANLQKNRSCQLENCCLLDQSRPVDYLEMEGGELAEAHSGISDFLGAAELSFSSSARTVTKQSDTLEAVFERHQMPPVIDYLSIDTEGSEYLILKNFPFDRYRFQVITIEHNNHPDQMNAQRSLLKGHGYRLLKTLHVDDYWMHSECPYLPAYLARERWKNFKHRLINFLTRLPGRIFRRLRSLFQIL